MAQLRGTHAQPTAELCRQEIMRESNSLHEHILSCERLLLSALCWLRQLPVSKRVASLAARLLDPSAPERQLKDQVYLGKAYLAQAQIDNNEAFAASLEQWIQSSESFLASSMQHRR